MKLNFESKRCRSRLKHHLFTKNIAYVHFNINNLIFDPSLEDWITILSKIEKTINFFYNYIQSYQNQKNSVGTNKKVHLCSHGKLLRIVIT